LLQGMTGRRGPSAVVAALFALHPLQTDSVAWVAERKNELSTCFWILTLLAYVRYAARPGWVRYLLVFVLMLLGLMAKPMLVTLPCVMLLLDFWPLGRLHPGSFSMKSNLNSKAESGKGKAETNQIQTSKSEIGNRKSERSQSLGGLLLEKLPLLALSA